MPRRAPVPSDQVSVTAPPPSIESPPARSDDFPRLLDSRQGVRRRPPSPYVGQQDYTERIDSLLASALQEQSREKRFLMETVYGAKSALVKAQEELRAIRELIAARDREVVGLLESRLPGVETEHLTTRVEAIERLVGKTDESVMQALQSRLEGLEAQDVNKRFDALNERMDAIEEAIIQLADKVIALGDRVGDEAAEVVRTVRSISDALVADLREDALEMVRTLRLLSETVVEDFKNVLEGSRKQMLSALQHSRRQSLELMKSVAANINDTTKITAEALAEHLTSYIAHRDERVGRARDQVVINLVRELGESLGRRERKKLGQVLSQPPGNLDTGSGIDPSASNPAPTWQSFQPPRDPSMDEARSLLAADDPRTGLSQTTAAARLLAESFEEDEEDEEDMSEYLRVRPPGVEGESESSSGPSRRRPAGVVSDDESTPARPSRKSKKAEPVQKRPQNKKSSPKGGPTDGQKGKSVTYRGRSAVRGE